MSELFQAVIASDEKADLRQFASDLRALGNKYLLRNDIDLMLRAMCTVTADYMSSACSFSEIWHAKPGTQLLLGETA